MKEFKASNYITLRLEQNETVIYVNDKRFEQCKFLLFVLPKEEMRSVEEIYDVYGINKEERDFIEKYVK